MNASARSNELSHSVTRASV